MAVTSLPISLSSSFYSDSKPANPPTQLEKTPDYISLNRLLTRLSHHILSEESSSPATSVRTNPRTLRQSPYHRTRTLNNIEYGRTILLRLESAAQGIKIQSQKKTVLKDLADKRRTLKKLRNKVEQFAQEGEPYADTYDDSEVEDYFPHLKKEPLATINVTKLDSSEQPKNERQPSTASLLSPNTNSSPRHQLLRRRAAKDMSTSVATTSGFSSLPTTESKLAHDSLTQEQLSTSMADLATQLKHRQLALQQGIEADKSLLSRAAEGLDRNLGGMDAAGRRMGVLRKMSEGKGWLGRMMLYAWIVGLWVVAVLLVFIGPKLRF